MYLFKLWTCVITEGRLLQPAGGGEHQKEGGGCCVMSLRLKEISNEQYGS